MKKALTDLFKNSEVTDKLKLAELPSSGQTTFWEGSTEQKFDRKETVGIKNILKIHH